MGVGLIDAPVSGAKNPVPNSTRQSFADALEQGHDISCTVDPGHCSDMNAPPNVDPATGHSDSDVVHWLTNGTRDERFIEALRNLIQADHG